MNDKRRDDSVKIKMLARRLGFSACGIIPARPFVEDIPHLQKWLRQGFHADMNYMQENFSKRTDPSLLVPGSKSVIVVLLNYFPEKFQSDIENNLIVSKYAYGNDYHKVMKKMLKTFLQQINNEIGTCTGRFFVDSAPILERAAARLAGLGWIGKNCNLLTQKSGSFFFIGELIVDLSLEYDKPVADYCGTCTRCIDACPTKALISPRKLDSNKCISYWTIENKGEINQELSGKFNNRIFGCDICQDVCPWNSKSKPGNFAVNPEVLQLKLNDWRSLDPEKFVNLFGNTPLKRAGYSGLMRNINFVLHSHCE